MKKVAVIAALLALIVALGSTGSSGALPLGGPAKSTPENLPVLKLPKDMAQRFDIPMGNPHGSPPGQTDKPDNPNKPDKSSKSNKLAVLIGIADYDGTDFDLWHPDEDAKEMARALQRNYGFANENMKVLLNQEATADAIISALDWLVTNENSESTVVFFYSGHGFRAPDDELWDTDSESDGFDEGIVSYDFYGLPDGWLQQEFSALESEKITFAFGSCYSGGMFDDDDDLQGTNRVIASACAADQLGWDYMLLGNTLWGKYFVDEALLQGMADKRGEVSIEEAHDYAVPRVVAEQPDSQPQLYDNYAGDLIP